MLLVDQLLSYERAQGSGCIFAKAKPQTVFSDSDGILAGNFLEEVVLLEMMAQAYACLRGYEDRLAGCKPSFGFLVGIRRLNIRRRVKVCEAVKIEVATKTSIGDFFIAEAVIKVESERVAEAELKLWVAPGTAGGDNS